MKHLCTRYGHIGYLVYVHNNDVCEKCLSRYVVEYKEDEVKEPKRVLVKSELGLLGHSQSHSHYTNFKKYLDSILSLLNT